MWGFIIICLAVGIKVQFILVGIKNTYIIFIHYCCMRTGELAIRTYSIIIVFINKIND